MKAVSVNVNSLAWSKTAEYPAGTEQKVLSEGGTIAPRVIMLKLPPGWEMGSHSHRFTELHYVLDGEIESQGKTYAAGTFRVIPESVEHGPFSSKAGATVLVIWCSITETEDGSDAGD